MIGPLTGTDERQANFIKRHVFRIISSKFQYRYRIGSVLTPGRTTAKAYIFISACI